MIDIDIFKRPEKNNDSYFIKINNFCLADGDIEWIKSTDSYISMKSDVFKQQNIKKTCFKNFKNRPSFRNFDKIQNLEGTVYTYAVENRNDVTYHQAINILNNMITHGFDNKMSTRCVLRMANSLKDYYLSEVSGKDVSCLSIIHYYAYKVALIFRASDIKNELFPDLITIYESFIKPVYPNFVKSVAIEIFASTGQNYEFFDEFIEKVKNLK